MSANIIERSVYIGKWVYRDLRQIPSMSVGKMDSPKLTEENCKYKLLFRAEKYLYRSINQADLLIDLRVSDKVALRRNNQRTKDYKETDSEILLRRSYNTDLNYDAKDFYTYDNNKRKEPAFEFIREKIWFGFDRSL